MSLGRGCVGFRLEDRRLEVAALAVKNSRML
jgi:hypothetical protein